jgi:gluconolactonase
MKRHFKSTVLIGALAATWLGADNDFRGIEHLVAEGASVVKIADGFGFLEGPVADAVGNLYFTDIPNRKIHVWTIENELKVFSDDSGGANGLAFDRDGNLIVCEDLDRRLVAIAPDGKKTVLADHYRGKRFNGPNDLWIDPKGGIYFTDPLYGEKEAELDGMYVFYLSPDRKDLKIAASGFVRPNGILGTPDGKRLFIADRDAEKNYVYDIEEDGRLSNKTLFSLEGSDGMTMDELGNVYVSCPRWGPTLAMAIYSPNGIRMGEIRFPEKPGNMHFAGKDHQTLFVPSRTSLYAIRMNVKGIAMAKASVALAIAAETPSRGDVLLPGIRINNNRDYTFREIDSELEGLNFIRLPHLYRGSYQATVTFPGILYLGLEVKEGVPLEQFTPEGWTLTDRTVLVNGFEGKIITLNVLKRRVAMNDKLEIPTVPEQIHFPPFLIGNLIEK